ncbi:MAG: amino acid adenylation domain-containing protein [Gloeotrichia echinulata GP01]
MVVAQEPSKKHIEAIYPLSPMQQGMLFHSLYNSESQPYLAQIQLTIYGKIEAFAFEQAWERVIERHPALRTLFVWKNPKQPLQVVRKQVNLPWINLDWRSFSPELQTQQLQAICESDRNQYFELDKAPLMRLTLIQMGDENYELIWTTHHILGDGWSSSIIFQEVLTFYQAIQQGEKLYLPPVRPYRDYIAWLQQQDLATAQTYWRQNLQGFTAPTPLVVDKIKGKSSHLSTTYNTQYFSLSAEATAKLKNFAQQHHLTLFTLMQAAWGILLSRYSGESDVVFGATVSGRPPALLGVESMVGLFVNTLPVRVKVTEKTEILPWLKQLQEQQIERDQYSYTPLVEIQGWSDIPRGQPLFESFVVFENLPVDSESAVTPDGWRIGKMENTVHADYPLTLVGIPGEELTLKITYASDRFEPDSITRMAGHFQTLLQGIVAEKDQKLTDLMLLTEPERHQLLVEWNQTYTKYPDQCIHQLFEEQVQQTPDAVAVVFDNQQLTYEQLNIKANQLAHYLQTLGVGTEVLVGICVERSLEMVVGLLAILKAGGAYLPLDPEYPQDRLSFMLADTQISVLLTQEKLVNKLPDHTACVICLDTNWNIINQQTQQNPNTSIKADNLAYVMYTSGSTGQPKGVSIVHQGVVRLVKQTDYISFSAKEVFLQVAPLSFDAATLEIWGCLLNSGKLVIFPAKNPSLDEIGLVIEQYKVTTLWLTSGLFNLMVDEKIDALKPLRQLLAGGDILSVSHVQKFLQTVGNCQLINGYGPTENTTLTSCYQIPTSLSLDVSVPIGRPIANTEVYILDQNLQPVPVGVPGELHIGGAGLARGYFNRTELTQEKFIPNPFEQSKARSVVSVAKQSQKSKLYKTGDLARYLPDGNIEFLGRIDNQVKIRGFRIELGEIESVLNKHPQINQTIVTVHGNNATEKFLAAYFIPIVGQTITPSELWKFLAQSLPEYMIPLAFVQMESFPLSPSGKVNRRSLPIPTIDRSELSQNYVAPNTPVQEVLADIWQEVLGVKQIGIDDNFFQLGGHSIKAIQLISQIRQTFELELTVRHLFNHPTIAELVVVLAKLAGGEEIIHEIAQTVQEISRLSPERVQALLTK